MGGSTQSASRRPAFATLYTGGTFDLFHAGHVNFLRQCSELAETVIVSLNTKEFVEGFKGRPPVMSFDERRMVLAACVHVDAVIKNVAGPDSRPAIEVVAPDVNAIGSDWKERDYHAQMGFTSKWLDERGIKLHYLSYTEGVSTTDVKMRVQGGAEDTQ